MEDIQSKVEQAGQAARRERLQSPDIIQRTSAKRYSAGGAGAGTLIYLAKLTSSAGDDNIVTALLYNANGQVPVAVAWQENHAYIPIDMVIGDGDENNYTCKVAHYSGTASVWQDEHDYYIGDVVKGNGDGNVYVCTKNHDSGEVDARPPTGTVYGTYWRSVGIEVTTHARPPTDTGWGNYWKSQEWISTTVYAVGDIVKGTDDKQYICITGHTAATVNKPATGDDWELYWVLQGITVYALLHKTEMLNTAFPRLVEGADIQVCQHPYNNGGVVEQRWYIVGSGGFQGVEAHVT